MAIRTYKAEVNSEGGLRCRAAARGFEVLMDEPKAHGGGDSAMTPLELLLSSLGGCMAITAKAHARRLGVSVAGCRVTIEGDLDPDGFMLKRDDVRTGFQEIRVTMQVSGDVPEEKLQELTELVERACPVSDSLRGVDIVAHATRDT